MDHFLGTPVNRLSDAQLADLFRAAAAERLAAGRADTLIDTVLGLERAPEVRTFISLARFA